MIHTSDEPLEIDQQLGVWSGWISFPLGRVYLAKMKAEYPKTHKQNFQEQNYSKQKVNLRRFLFPQPRVISI